MTAAHALLEAGAAAKEEWLDPPINRLTPTDGLPDDEWVARLSASGPIREDALRRLHGLMLRAARHQVSRMPAAAGLGAAVRDELVHAAADEATVSVLARLDSFERRSRFTTWAYKFGILQAGVEIRRATWRDREVQVSDLPERVEPPATGPEAYTEGRDLAGAVHRGMRSSLTAHQQRVTLALLVDEVPIDVLAERLNTTRGALYKTLHDARKRLRGYLHDEGYLPSASEVST